MRKGLFWAIDRETERRLLTYSAVCDKNGAVEAGQPPYNSKKGDSFSHERSWPLATESLSQRICNRPWNHFPRGRVEIANGKATVYYNPVLSEWADFETAVVREFELDGFPMRFVPDYSSHYESKGDKDDEG